MLDLEWIIPATEEVGLEWGWGFTPLATEAPTLPAVLMKQPASGTTYGDGNGAV